MNESTQNRIKKRIFMDFDNDKDDLVNPSLLYLALFEY